MHTARKVFVLLESREVAQITEMEAISRSASNQRRGAPNKWNDQKNG